MPKPSGAPILSTDFRLKASRQSERLPQMVDGDLDSRWLSADPQDGSEWIQVTFNRPRHPLLLRLDVGGRSFGDYPREMLVECSVDTVMFHEIFVGRSIWRLTQSLLERPQEPGIDIELPGTECMALRIRQTGRVTRSWFWSVDELKLWE